MVGVTIVIISGPPTVTGIGFVGGACAISNSEFHVIVHSCNYDSTVVDEMATVHHDVITVSNGSEVVTPIDCCSTHYCLLYIISSFSD